MNAVQTRSALVDGENLELVVRLLTRHQEELFSFIFSLHPHEEDARDVLQETSVALCRKVDEYDPSQAFLPWAFAFAQLEVLKQRERNQRHARLLSREVVDRLAVERADRAMEMNLEMRMQALEQCLAKLPLADQNLIRVRYQVRSSIEEVIEKIGTSRRSVFRNLQRIRRWLFDCISNRVASQDNP